MSWTARGVSFFQCKTTYKTASQNLAEVQSTMPATQLKGERLTTQKISHQLRLKEKTKQNLDNLAAMTQNKSPKKGSTGKNCKNRESLRQRYESLVMRKKQVFAHPKYIWKWMRNLCEESVRTFRGWITCKI